MGQYPNDDFEAMASGLRKVKRQRLEHELALARVGDAVQTQPDTAEGLRAAIGSLLLFKPLP